MKILEQILEEINRRINSLDEKAGRYEDSGLQVESDKIDCEIKGLRTAKNIIHSHMEDDGWIPVEERLPEAEGRYLAVFGNDDTVHLLGYGNCQRDIFGRKKGFGWYDLPSGNYFAANAVKAWRPLPEPYQPKEEKR